MAEDLIGQFGYLGIVLLLVLGGLGLPVPEEAPIILAAILSKKGAMWPPMAFGSCVAGVLIGDFVVYGLGYVYGERVLGFRLTRTFLTRAREAQIKGYFRRHGLKILVLGRFAVGFRTAAYLTAGILRHPPLKLLVTDLFAVLLSTPLMFALGWAFAHQIEAGIREVQHYLAVILAAVLVGWLVVRSHRARRRGGRPVGPPVLEEDEAPLPPGDPAPGLDPGEEMAVPPTSSSPIGPPPPSSPSPTPGPSKSAVPLE
ncbi:DedA family protein [Tautonia sociabilis]|uniref:DedA family protein n=1 Tax=Tautonia sociabilis TaxID=2080755 RepID=A0A432MK05_9BACT|nr:DedA family protein [Tautonia sociabilis]RUL87590.1 DedA family protein [Tautonia sociabilis]